MSDSVFKQLNKADPPPNRIIAVTIGTGSMQTAGLNKVADVVLDNL